MDNTLKYMLKATNLITLDRGTDHYKTKSPLHKEEDF